VKNGFATCSVACGVVAPDGSLLQERFSDKELLALEARVLLEKGMKYRV